MTDRLRVLHLVLKGRWFNLIESGAKREEYRDISPYWEKRLNNHTYDRVKFRHGYRTDARTMTFEINEINKGLGLVEHGAPDYPVFIIWLGNRVDAPTKRRAWQYPDKQAWPFPRVKGDK